MQENVKYSFKLILMECLKELNLEKIKNNEVILSYIAMQLGDMCGDMSYTLLHCRDSKEEYDSCKSEFINILKNELNKRFKIYVNDEKVVIEQTYIQYVNGEKIYLDNDMEKTINKQVLENVSSILKNMFNGCRGNFDINTYKLTYDKKRCKTFYLENERTYNVNKNIVSNKPVLNIYDVVALEEYNKNYEMISDKKYISERNYNIEDANFINNIKYSDELNNDEKQEFVTGGDITQCNFKYLDNEYSFILPTSRDAQIIDYIDGRNSFINLEGLDEQLEFIAEYQEFYDEKPVVGITYVYSEKFLETVRDIKQDYEDKIGEKIGREMAKKMGYTC